MFETLIACLPELEKESSGEWIVDPGNDGSEEQPFQLPFIRYSEGSKKIIKEILNIEKNYADLKLDSYREILERNGIEWRAERMQNADILSLDAQCVMALLMGAVRADRYREGTFKSFIDRGCIKRWIIRLKEIEESNPNRLLFDRDTKKTEMGKNNESAKEYRVIVCDESETPVQGARVQFCSDAACQMKETDQDGTAVFDCGEGNYTVHVFAVPAGYVKDETEYPAPEQYGDVRITLHAKEEKED